MINHAATQLNREPVPPASSDSAEAGAAAQAPKDACTRSASTPSDAGDGRINDSAEADAAAQAPRDGGTPPASSPSDAADSRNDDSAEASTEREAASAPGPSVLHQRADAARRGFHRADALVSVAQGYLRGDRPQRSPIEVTVTTASSSCPRVRIHDRARRRPAASVPMLRVGSRRRAVTSWGGGSRMASDPRGERVARNRREHDRLRVGWQASRLRHDRRTSGDRRWPSVR